MRVYNFDPNFHKKIIYNNAAVSRRIVVQKILITEMVKCRSNPMNFCKQALEDFHVEYFSYSLIRGDVSAMKHSSRIKKCHAHGIYFRLSTPVHF